MENKKLIGRVELNDEMLDMVSGGTFPVEEVERVINLYYTLHEKNPAYEKDDECELGYWLGEPFWGRGCSALRLQRRP